MEKPNAENHENVDAEYIKELLISRERRKRKFGITLLCEKYRDQFCNALLNISNDRQWGLQDDIADIWQDTMIKIVNRVENRQFKKSGSLEAFIYNVMTGRAVEYIRKRRARDTHHQKIAEEARVGDSGDDDSRETPPIAHDWMLVEYIKELCKQKDLPETQKIVINHYVTLLVTTWALPGKKLLADSFNEEWEALGKERLSVDAVHSAKMRGISTLGGSERQRQKKKNKNSKNGHGDLPNQGEEK